MSSKFIHPSVNLDEPAKWDGFSYMTDCPAFHFSISKGRHQPYWEGDPPRDSELNIVASYITKTERHGTFLDVGGHIGTMSIPFSLMYDNVHAFEPCETNYKFLTENIKTNEINNVHAHNVAVSNRVSKVSVFRHYEHNSGCYAVKDDSEGSVDCITLDDLGFEDVDFVKIDVQGKELEVLEGAINTIRKYKPLLMIEVTDKEQTEEGLKGFIASKKEVVEFLSEEGYAMYHDNGGDIFMCAEGGLGE
ncbi:MAG: FkbM family methyltransferase [Candidatus Kariarchaeaceae archaeon]|jgi:FkbM family methyltransferase